MAVPQREQALSLLAAANNHGDLAVKLSSLKQAKDILLSSDLSSLAAELFPYLVALQSSHERLVRKTLVEATEEISLKVMEYSPVLIPVLLTLLHDNDSVVARHSIVAGTKIFCKVVDELALQFQRHRMVGKWLEELWCWMIKFKESVFQIPFEAGSVGPKLLAVKFLETFVLLFTSDIDSRGHVAEEVARSGQVFNISWLVGGHPVLDSVALQSEANRSFYILLDLLKSASSLPGSITISVVNSLATIARRRPVYYSSVLSVLLDFDANFVAKGVHNASIQYSIRTAFLGFLRSAHPIIMESREKLLKALRAMNAGDAADQVMRQVDKMLRNSERASRDARVSKDEQTSSHMATPGDMTRKRSSPMDQEHIESTDLASKRSRFGSNNNVVQSDTGHNNMLIGNGTSSKVPPLDNGLTPVEQMITMIGALLAEGERGAESLEILISQIHPDLLADIVIANMKHLPKNPPPLTRLSSLPLTRQSSPSTNFSEVVAPISLAASTQPGQTAQVPPSNAISTPSSGGATPIGFQADSKRDSRRDPRRLDPRRAASTAGAPSEHTMEDILQSGIAESEVDASTRFKKQPPLPVVPRVEKTSEVSMPKTETEMHNLEKPNVSEADQSSVKEQAPDEQVMEVSPDVDLKFSISPVHNIVKDLDTPKSKPIDISMTDEDYSPSLMETDQLSPSTVDTPGMEETTIDLPILPLYVELTEEQQKTIRKLAIKRIIDSYKQSRGTEFMQTRMELLSRLVAQVDADDDVIVMIQTHIVSDYQHQKGHDLVMHVLYHLHTLMMSDSAEHSSFAAVVYEKFLLGVAKCLLDAFPASDKSFSRIFSEAPSLPQSAIKLLDDICCSENNCGKDLRDGDRVTQGLGSLWSLILGRPLNRQAFLDIALKCAVHPKDDIRAKAIRLVANKLYVINFISEKIEEFATNKLLSAVNRSVLDAEHLHSGASDQRTEGQMGSRETSISGSQISEPGTSENDSAKGVQSDSQSDSSMSPAQAQQHLSLFFALCTKKPSLLQLVFERYAHAPKAVKQAIHRHVPVLIRALGPSYSDLLRIISDPPQGSENLLTQVLHVLTEGTTPSDDLVATVKRLYESKLKDATILIPILSSFTKNEVLPIFPRLVQLPLDKFQTALAHILQGSAHMGPALTPAEVLVAIHDINPEKDGLPLKKIMDACSACFEQRTVFTQQVLAKALNQMVDQTPLPLLFMRTVIQAIDAFPTLVDFVMEILSKLVTKQVWRMPKLWVGFLKCVSQTQPHSFRVLLQLPSPQLEGTLNKYGSLRAPLAAYANQPSVRASLPRSTLLVLGLASEPQLQQPNLVSS